MDYVFTHGTGTEADPYQVWTAEDLDGVRDYLDAHFIQMADIDLSVYENWEPIGTSGTPFEGIYDGNGHKIDNLTINRPTENNIGLFAVLSISETHDFSSVPTATIKNLGITNVNVSGAENVGGLTGGILNSSTVSNCYSTGSVSGDRCVGGLVGFIWFSAVYSCYSANSVSGADYIGGLIGLNHYHSTTSNCYSTSNVSGQMELVV